MALRYNPPPGWTVPQDDWRPPLDWMPDPSWPPAPELWEFWLDVEQKAKHRPRQRSRRRFFAVVAIVTLLAFGVMAKAKVPNRVDSGERRVAPSPSLTENPIATTPPATSASPAPPPTTKIQTSAAKKPTSQPSPTSAKPVPTVTTTSPTPTATVPNPIRHSVSPGGGGGPSR
jgi:hypothetical protein